jgi:hypothetical protein
MASPLKTYIEIAQDSTHPNRSLARKVIQDRQAYYTQAAMIFDAYLQHKNVPHRPVRGFSRASIKTKK